MSNCNFELCDFGDLKNSSKKKIPQKVSTWNQKVQIFFLILTIFWHFSVFLLILFICLSYLFGCAESSFL